MKWLLGSQSPRRQELLKSLGFPFKVVNIHCQEIYPQDLEPEKIPAYLSELKADAFRDLEKDEVLLTADTLVVLDKEILGKPKDNREAKEMLQKLSGKTHKVITAFSLKTQNNISTITDVAEVEFEVLSEEEINFYIKNQNPLDKAGAYGIQDWMGLAKIKTIKGSYYTIMGLPTHLVYEALTKL